MFCIYVWMVYDWVKKTAKLSLVLVLLIQKPKKEEGKKKKGYTLPHRKQMPSREPEIHSCHQT